MTCYETKFSEIQQSYKDHPIGKVLQQLSNGAGDVFVRTSAQTFFISQPTVISYKHVSQPVWLSVIKIHYFLTLKSCQMDIICIFVGATEHFAA